MIPWLSAICLTFQLSILFYVLIDDLIAVGKLDAPMINHYGGAWFILGFSIALVLSDLISSPKPNWKICTAIAVMQILILYFLVHR
jgi:hypothetical protein